MQIIIDANTVSVIAAFAAVVAAFISAMSLHEAKNARIESARAVITVNFVRVQRENGWRIVIKNYGQAPGTLHNIVVSPPLTYEKMSADIQLAKELPILTDATNIFLAPGQVITDAFEFNHYQDKIFDVTVNYDTLGRHYSESYQIDLNFRQGISHYDTFRADENITSAVALKKIAENSEWFFERCH